MGRTTWRSIIKEDDVEGIVKTIPDIENINGKYTLQKEMKRLDRRLVITKSFGMKKLQ